MSDTYNKLQYGNSQQHWKILDLISDLNYFYYSNLNPTHLPQHQTLSPNNQFSQRIWYVEYYSVHAHTAWSQKFRKSEISFDTGLKKRICPRPTGRYWAGFCGEWAVRAKKILDCAISKPHTCACNICIISSLVISWQLRRIDRNSSCKPVSVLFLQLLTALA